MVAHVEDDPAGRRRPQSPEELTPDAIRWLAELPADARPTLLPVEFPRIVNALVRRWSTPSFSLAYFEELLVDRRGSRRGFPLPVMLEIAALKTHYQTNVHAMPRTVWEDIAQRSGYTY